MEEKNPSDPRGPSLPGRGVDALWRCNMKVPPQFFCPVSCAKEHADAFRRGKYKILFLSRKNSHKKKEKGSGKGRDAFLRRPVLLFFVFSDSQQSGFLLFLSFSLVVMFQCVSAETDGGATNGNVVSLSRPCRRHAGMKKGAALVGLSYFVYRSRHRQSPRPGRHHSRRHYYSIHSKKKNT